MAPRKKPSKPIRVFQIGNFNPPHSTENELRVALEVNGVEVVRAQEHEFDWAPDAANGCDFVMWTHTFYMTTAEQYPAITKFQAAQRKAKRPMVGYHLDRWMGLDREIQLTFDPYFRNSLLISADGGHEDAWPEYGINHVWMPPAVSHVGVDLDVDRPHSRLRLKKVGFVGSWHGYHPEWAWREKLVLWLRRTYQSRLALYPVYGRGLRGKDLNTVYQQVPVIVGDSCLAPTRDGAPMHHYWSDRIPETIGRGGFLLHPYVAGLDEYFTDGEHLVCYEAGDFEALAGLIEHYYTHPDERDRIVKAGREHVRANHTYRHRMAAVLDLVKQGKADWV
jgi:glycosyltransferase involved in cell wall biosynthesis